MLDIGDLFQICYQKLDGGRCFPFKAGEVVAAMPCRLVLGNRFHALYAEYRGAVERAIVPLVPRPVKILEFREE